MAKHIMAVYSNAKPGRDAEYMNWYRNVHLGEVGAIPGVKSGHVYEAITASPTKPAATYMAIYELEVDDPTSVLAELGRRGKAGELHMTDAMDVASSRITLLKQNF